MASVAYVLFVRDYPRDAVAEVDRRLAPRRALAVIAIYGMMVVVLWTLYQTRMIVV